LPDGRASSRYLCQGWTSRRSSEERFFVRLHSKIAIAFAALAAGALVWLLVPRRGRQEQVIEAAWAEERSTDPRPSHVAVPLPGSFGELLEPHLSALHESLVAFKGLGPSGISQAARVYKGQEPIARLGPEIAADLALHRDAIQSALRATHARSARAPASLRLFAVFGPGADTFMDVQHAARLSALDVLTLIDRGRAEEAADECADMLALGRDLSYPSVLGRMIGVAVTDVSSYACGRALSVAPAGSLERLRSQLLAIRAGTPRFAGILQREWLFQQLLLTDPDPRWPESARTLIREARDQNRNLDRLEWVVFHATARDRLAARTAEFLDAQRLDWPACADRMEEVTRRFEWNPLVRDAFVPLLRRHRNGLLRIDALVCAASVSLARARTGALPRDAASACPPIEPEAKCGEQAAPLRIADQGGVSHVSVTLSDGSDYTVPLAGTAQSSAGRVAPR
jgi:hypothetical protein